MDISKYFAEKDLLNAYSLLDQVIRNETFNFKSKVSDVQVFSNTFEVERATIVDVASPYMEIDGATPEYSNADAKTFVGSFDAIGNHKMLGLKRFMELKRHNSVSQAIIEMYNLAKGVTLSNLWRQEDIFLQSLSKTKISLKALTNNARGIDKVLDFQVPAAQKVGVATSWSVSHFATPFKNIRDFVKALKKKGINPTKILMTGTVIDRLLVCQEIIDLNLVDRSTIDGEYVSLEKFNKFLQVQRLPIIEEITDNVIHINKSNVIDPSIESYKEENIVFTTSDNYGQRLWLDPVGEREAARLNGGVFSMADRMALLNTVEGTDPVNFKVMGKFYGTIVLNSIYGFGFMSTEHTTFQSV